MQRKKVVILGGGTGTSSVLRGLKYFPIDITAGITVSDNGSSISFSCCIICSTAILPPSLLARRLPIWLSKSFSSREPG